MNENRDLYILAFRVSSKNRNSWGCVYCNLTEYVLIFAENRNRNEMSLNVANMAILGSKNKFYYWLFYYDD